MSELGFEDLDALEATEIPAEEKIEDKNNVGVKMAFIGVGQGGCRLADTLWKLGYRKIILFNTTPKDMEGLEASKNTHVIPEGMDGAGKNPEYGEKAAQSVIPELIKKMNMRFSGGVDQIMICVGSGGGTGTGAASVIAKVAKNWIYQQTGDTSGSKVGFMIALPARSEGSRVLGNTNRLIKEIMDVASFSPIMFMDNQRITEAVQANAKNKWQQANAMVCQLFHIFNMMCAKTTEHDTFDPQDYKDVLGRGVMTMAMASVLESSIKEEDETGLAKPTLLSDKVRSTLGASLLLQDVDISTATHAAVIVSCREEALERMSSDTMSKLSETLISMMGGDLGKNVTIHRGLYTRDSDDSDSKIRIFLMLSGMEFPKAKLASYAMAAESKKD